MESTVSTVELPAVEANVEDCGPSIIHSSNLHGPGDRARWLHCTDEEMTAQCSHSCLRSHRYYYRPRAQTRALGGQSLRVCVLNPPPDAPVVWVVFSWVNVRIRNQCLWDTSTGLSTPSVSHAGCYTVTIGTSQTNESGSSDLWKRRNPAPSFGRSSPWSQCPKESTIPTISGKIRNVVWTIVTTKVQIDHWIMLFLRWLDFMKLKYT